MRSRVDAAGAVGDRHERRTERFEVDERLRERLLHLFGARRPELEGVAASPLQDLADLQAPTGYRDGLGRNPRNRRSRSELVTTNTDEKPIAAAAITGFSRPTAASGMAATL